MQLLSVNVSAPKPVPYRGHFVLTGIFKEPVASPVRVRRLGLEGDGQADLRVHGGLNKAVYAYPFEHYAAWAAELGRDDLRPGQFGENLTVEGLLEDAVGLGDVFRVGGALLQVTQPRVPCFKLGLKMGSAAFPKRFLHSGRTGFYLRVLEEGEVQAGDAPVLLREGDAGLTVQDVWRLTFFAADDVEGARRALRVPTLGPEWRGPLEERVAEAGP